MTYMKYISIKDVVGLTGKPHKEILEFLRPLHNEKKDIWTKFWISTILIRL